MKKLVKINQKRPEGKKIARAARVIKGGGVIIFPTETVYGLGCSPFNKKAVKRIFELKGRASKKPLAVIVENFKQVKQLTKKISPRAKDLMTRFWPGPLTLILYKSNKIPNYVTCGSKKIGIRMPDHPITLELLKACRMPIVATSANKSGSTPPLTAGKALKQIKDVDMAIDGGRTSFKKASTVVDATKSKLKILRAGSLSKRLIGIDRP
jgi:L-threonylcarbamoyladenylate synthase